MRENIFDKPDAIAMYYLREMAVDIGPSFSRLTKNRGNYKVDGYLQNKDLPIHSSYNDIIKTHVFNDGDSTHYYTLDHQNKTVAHYAKIKKDSNTFQFPVEEQHNVDKDKSNTNLPKGFATEFIYNHFKNSELPLRSSDEQFHDGHFMWRRLVDKALAHKHLILSKIPLSFDKR